MFLVFWLFACVQLRRFGSLGGVDPTVYRCARELRFGNLTSLVEREAKTAEMFQRACQSTADRLQAMVNILKKNEVPQSNTDAGVKSGMGHPFGPEPTCVPQDGAKPEGKTEHETDTPKAGGETTINRLLLDGAADDLSMANNCVEYFRNRLHQLEIDAPTPQHKTHAVK
eukprot:GHVT01047797.1.p1 GENE.GHVT01047797.1~~GHVT01047797.1.p1  ORF type:complete len:170 (-),score=24.30 GHVT01047797.1:1127-1636(-)